MALRGTETIVVILSATLLGACASLPKSPRSIVVSGSSSVFVVPDQVEVSIGIEKSSKNVKDAKLLSDQSMARILEVAKAFKIPDTDIQSDYNRVDLENTDPEGRREGFRFVARRSVRILLKDTKIYDALTGKLFEVGANVLSDVNFKTSTQKAQEAEARRRALQAAKQKAKDMANELGMELGAPLLISDLSGGATHYAGMEASADMNISAAMRKGGGASPSGPTLALGQLEIQAEVSVRFEMN